MDGVLEGTKVKCCYGIENIEDVNVGTVVLTAKTNGKTGYHKVIDKNKIIYEKTIKIKTANGKEILVTPHLRMYVITPNDLYGEKWYIYLMWRKDLGFRIGRTSNTLKQRLHQQTASKMWVIDTAYVLKDAIYLEEFYSLNYQLPKITYNLSEMGVENTQLLFRDFGYSGYKLLVDKFLDFNLPHIQTQATNRQGRCTVNVNVLMGGSKFSSLNIDTSDKKAIEILNMLDLKLTDAKVGKRLRFNSVDYKKVYILANKIEAEFQKNDINYKMNYQSGYVNGSLKLNIINASGVYEGMNIAVNSKNQITTDKVVNVEILDGEFRFYNIEVEKTHNVIVNDFVIHTAINETKLCSKGDKY
jgi:hypothetical protein